MCNLVRLHWLARTTPAIRAEIAANNESIQTLAENTTVTREIASNMERIAQSAENNAEVAHNALREARKVGELAAKLKTLASQFHV